MPIVSRQTGTKLTIAEDNLIRSVGRLEDPVGAFIELACVPRHFSHGSGTLEHTEMILPRYQTAPGTHRLNRTGRRHLTGG
jgi:hypothetical protein